MKFKTYINSFLKVLLVILIIFTAYCSFFLYPGLKLPSKILKIERVFLEQQSLLLENRILMISLTRQDPLSPNFNEDKNTIFSGIATTNNKGQELLQKEIIQKDIGEIKKDEIDFLFQKTDDYYKKQNREIVKLTDYDSIVEKIYLYDAQSDLVTLDLEKDKDSLLSKAGNAQNGLEKIKENLENYQYYPGKLSNIITEIDKTISNLINFQELLDKNQIQEADIQRDIIIKGFQNLKTTSYETLVTFIKSEVFVNLLLEQTKLLNDYQNYLNIIDDMKIELQNF